MRKDIKTILGLVVVLIIVVILVLGSSPSTGVQSVNITTVGSDCLLNTTFSIPEDMPNSRVSIYAYDSQGQLIGEYDDGVLYKDNYQGNTEYWMTRSFDLDTNDTTNQAIHIKYLTYEFANDYKLYTLNYTVDEYYDNVTYT
ncbi:hypothetical protein [Methanosphaera sp. WGK6]|uniref:hypothetical protein n=1 Tax=Methanosphaera sp. WGK6 TaxID=1561964 RepID=UPI00084BCAED|nr:hypothetical protein [Methanosphaera sp. WGK6]OED29495.1 hypothetical protein NL43_07985 [Methanosphaera sp. WGK6]